MRVRTRRFNPRCVDQRGEQVTPRDPSGSPIPAPATTCSSFQHHWRWSWPYASSPCGSSRDGSPDDVTRLNALTPDSACAGSASVSSNTCECGDPPSAREDTALIELVEQFQLCNRGLFVLNSSSEEEHCHHDGYIRINTPSVRGQNEVTCPAAEITPQLAQAAFHPDSPATAGVLADTTLELRHVLRRHRRG